jgi:PAS domain S-box-containing protein
MAMDTNFTATTLSGGRPDALRAWWAAVISSSDDAIIGKTLDGVILSWNPGAERIFGYTAAEAVGQPIFLIIPDDRRAEEEEVLARLRRGERVEHFETVRRTKDGRQIPISLSVSPVRDDQGHIIGASKVARDISLQHQRDELRARLTAIVQSSEDAIVSKTLEGVITSWNAGAERIFGYTAAEAIGQPIFLIIPDDRRAEEEEVLARLRRGERVEHFETVRRTKDGRQIAISLSVSPVMDDQGNVIGASKVARDISERLRAQEALRRAHDELEERVRLRTAQLREEMAQRQRAEQERIHLLTRLVVAQEDERQRIARDLHDQLGQQLTALRLTLETLKEESIDRTELRTQIETLQEVARQLDEDVAFRVKGLRSSVLESLGLAQALRDYVGNWSKHFKVRAQVHTSASADERLPFEIEIMMYRVVQEALNNVIKHARASHVDIVLERSPESVSLIVEDNGIGFDPANLANPDAGVGLIGMRERAALVGADLQIESTPGQGTTVFTRVPVVAATDKRT